MYATRRQLCFLTSKLLLRSAVIKEAYVGPFCTHSPHLSFLLLTTEFPLQVMS